MNAKEEFERIKKVFEETNNISLGDIDLLIRIIQALNSRLNWDEKNNKKYLKIKEILNSRFFEFNEEFGEFCYKDFVIKSKIEELKDLINE